MKNNKDNKKFFTFTKRLVAIIIVFCLVNIEMSYILSALGKDPLTDVTNNLITTVLGTSAIYIVRAFFDSWSKAKYGDGSDDTTIIPTADDKTPNIIDPHFGVDVTTISMPCSDTTSEDDNNNDDNYGN